VASALESGRHWATFALRHEGFGLIAVAVDVTQQADQKPNLCWRQSSLYTLDDRASDWWYASGQCSSVFGQLNLNDAAVRCASNPVNESVRFQAVDKSCHGTLIDAAFLREARGAITPTACEEVQDACLHSGHAEFRLRSFCQHVRQAGVDPVEQVCKVIVCCRSLCRNAGSIKRCQVQRVRIVANLLGHHL
jgi:hypothetical protein